MEGSSVPLLTPEVPLLWILLISHIGVMQGEFANTLVIEISPNQSSRVKVVE
ncbi:MAG: hypothetical protein Q7U51_02850 [Methanoregula sp.]|nr:hypothetical protein [Methanoregula sp.]